MATSMLAYCEATLENEHFEDFQNVFVESCIEVLGDKLALNGLGIKLFSAFLFAKNEHWIITMV